MKLPSLFRNKETTKPQPWQWPSCNHPRTLSFRAGDDIFKTVNSVFFDPVDGVETPGSWFTKTSSYESSNLSTESGDFDGESLEMVVRGVTRSERLFFQPDDTSSILEESKPSEFPFKESVVLAMDSEDPYVDFRRSMEEMVQSHGLKDWECLEELLGWYLKVNGKKNHGYILGAFVDLLMNLAAASCNNSDSTCYSSAASSFSSSPLCSLMEGDVHIDEEELKVLS
ncbi:Ovate domain-containing protein [Cephalotus follicularis]|uniref:Transcription repressor n=1 Tax=Cephalotus follicularis TaxID=3775 RepID=A0A1Q3BTI9_CEPFO|nr:Ovate domain-containing protein [Cephalotus follicularis]